MNTTPVLLSADPSTAQGFVTPVHQLQLRVHRDGRASNRDLTGRWVRYTTEIPAEIFYRVPQSQRHRLLQDSFAGSRADAAQVVAVRALGK